MIEKKINYFEKTILIVSGSKYGSTEEIAEKIGIILREKGFQIEIVHLSQHNKNSIQNIEHYDGIILGSGVYAGSWTSQIKKFLKINSDILKQRTLAAFAVCGEAHNEDRVEIARENYVNKVLKKYSLTADYSNVFAGVLDLSPTSPYNKFELKIVQMINKHDNSVDLHSRNDYRNWDVVHQFAENFALLFQFIAETKKASNIDECSVMK